MRSLVAVVVRTAALCVIAGCANGAMTPTAGVRPGSGGAAAIADRWLLVYAGTWGTPSYDSAAFVRLMGRDTSALHCERPLFDGAIFLSIALGPDRPLFASWLPAARKLGVANGAEWAEWLDTLFAPSGAMHRLDRALGTAGGAGRLRVAVMLPYLGAASDTMRWQGARYAPQDTVAVRAFYDAFLADVQRRFHGGGYAHLRLTGAYWLNEALMAADDSARLAIVAAAVHRAGLRFLWIPWYGARGAASWRALGFDQAWYQPNRFFHAEIADARIDTAVAFAREHRMGVEIEFDRRMLGDVRMLPRLDAYLARVDGTTTRSVAVYEGAGALAALLADRRAEYRAVAERLLGRLCAR